MHRTGLFTNRACNRCSHSANCTIIFLGWSFTADQLRLYKCYYLPICQWPDFNARTKVVADVEFGFCSVRGKQFYLNRCVIWIANGNNKIYFCIFARFCSSFMVAWWFLVDCVHLSQIFKRLFWNEYHSLAVSIYSLGEFCECLMHVKYKCITYSVDSIVGVVGIIIKIQFVRMVMMMKNEKYGCTKM